MQRQLKAITDSLRSAQTRLRRLERQSLRRGVEQAARSRSLVSRRMRGAPEPDVQGIPRPAARRGVASEEARWCRPEALSPRCTRLVHVDDDGTTSARGKIPDRAGQDHAQVRAQVSSIEKGDPVGFCAAAGGARRGHSVGRPIAARPREDRLPVRRTHEVQCLLGAGDYRAPPASPSPAGRGSGRLAQWILDFRRSGTTIQDAPESPDPLCASCVWRCRKPTKSKRGASPHSASRTRSSQCTRTPTIITAAAGTLPGARLRLSTSV